MKIRQLDIDGVFEITPDKFSDARGFFSETFNAARFEDIGVNVEWVQDNHSFSADAGVLRGLHFQNPPMAQDKLVRVVQGSIYDVAVDIRRGSPTFGRWTAATLSAENWKQLFVPKGFAHGFVTLEPNVEVIYKVSALYSKEHDRSIRFDDPEIAIDWPEFTSGPTLSEKDAKAPFLKDADADFQYEARVKDQ